MTWERERILPTMSARTTSVPRARLLRAPWRHALRVGAMGGVAGAVGLLYEMMGRFSVSTGAGAARTPVDAGDSGACDEHGKSGVVLLSGAASNQSLRAHYCRACRLFVIVGNVASEAVAALFIRIAVSLSIFGFIVDLVSRHTLVLSADTTSHCSDLFIQREFYR